MGNASSRKKNGDTAGTRRRGRLSRWRRSKKKDGEDGKEKAKSPPTPNCETTEEREDNGIEVETTRADVAAGQENKKDSQDNVRGIEPVVEERESSVTVANNKFSLRAPSPSYDGILPKPQTDRSANLLTVVLDMDETLIHSKFQSQQNSFRQEEKRQNNRNRGGDITFDLVLGNGSMKERVEVFKRPGLDYFLKEASKHFEVVVFTAAIPVYAQPVLDRIDPEGVIKHRLYRDSTVTFEGQPYVKDLSLLGRDMSRIVLVDNNPAAMLACPDNAIPILSYYDSDTDRELESLLPLLLQLQEAEDVRQPLIQRFGFRAMIEEAKRLAQRDDK